MQNKNEMLRIGRLYRWGDRYTYNSTLLAGFFHDKDNESRTVALTIRPPSGYESEHARRIEIIDGLICLLQLDDRWVDRNEDQTRIFRHISHTAIPFGSSCELIGPDAERKAASIVGTHRVVKIRGTVYRGLYEVSLPSPAAGMAGAPIIWQDMLCGLIVADGGKGDTDYRAFAVTTHRLCNRLWLLPRTHADDTEYSNQKYRQLASWSKARIEEPETMDA